MVLERVRGAFPAAVAGVLPSVLALLPPASGLAFSDDDVGPVTLHGERLRIPYRVYLPEPHAVPESFTPVQRSVLSCLYTRHHDGYVREHHLRFALRGGEEWVVPYVLCMLADYVVEIAALAAHGLDGELAERCAPFVRENPGFVATLKRRMISYWDCYYRQPWQQPSYRRLRDYPPVQHTLSMASVEP